MRRVLLILLAALAGCGGGSAPVGERAAAVGGGNAAAPNAPAGKPGGEATPNAPTGKPGGAATPNAPTGQAAPNAPAGQAAPNAPAGQAAPNAPAGRAAPVAPTAQPPALHAERPGPPLAAGRWATARITRRIALRATPRGRAVGAIGPRTEFGGPRVVSVLRRSGAWLNVVVPERPNSRPAWIPAGRARLGATDVSLLVDRSDRTLTVRRGARVMERITIGVGAVDHPTPTGRFAVTDKLRMGGPGTTYGCCAIALSAHQRNLPPTWRGLDRIAVHGTQSPQTIGLAASLGCMHASERDLRRLMRTVPLGAPVFIRA